MELNSVKRAVEPPRAGDGEPDGPVVIAGAGPTGLVLAVELRRRGVPVRLLERHGALFPGSRGKGLQPRTREVFDDLGVGEAVTAVGGPYPPMQVWQDGVRAHQWDLVGRTGPVPGAPYHEVWMVPQFRTQQLLYERLQQLGGSVEFGTEVTGLSQDSEGVTAILASGRTVRGRYLVAADGGRSTVRRALGVPMTGESVDPSPMLVGDVQLGAAANLGRDAWHLWRQDGGTSVGLCPLAGTDLFQLGAAFPPGTPVDTSTTAVRRLLADQVGIPESAVEEVRWASDFSVRAALADRFRDGRVFLAGDAAHVHSPAGGQGLNTGIQDAYNLGWKLAEVLQGAAGPELLDSYAAEREPVAAHVLGLSTRIHRATKAGDGRGMRRGPETHQLDVGYPDSPLSRDSRRPEQQGELRAGDRAPDAECVTGDGERLRLFDAFRATGWTLLAFGGAEPPSMPRCPAYRIKGTEPHAERAYGSGLFLIRPDGHLAVAAASAADLR